MTDAPLRLRTNEFWGKRSGFIHKTRGPIIPGRRASSTHSSNSATPNPRWYHIHQNHLAAFAKARNRSASVRPIRQSPVIKRLAS